MTDNVNHPLTTARASHELRQPPCLFPTFFLAGFECATGYNEHGQWLDQIAATQHDRFLNDDYRRLLRIGIRAVREGVRWPLVDRRGRYDFSSVRPFIEAGRRFGIVQVWDLFHYGYPDDVDPFSREFIARFADYCYAVARYLGARTEGTAFFTPVNEPSFFAWAGGEAGRFAPHRRGRGWELKVQLCRAAIAGIEAIWAACPHSRIVNVDPICRVVAPRARPDLIEPARQWNEYVFQGWDIIAGQLLPELGGSRRHLDIVGINYYWTNQWYWTDEWARTGRCQPMDAADPLCAPLSDLVEKVWRRYGGQVMISETSHAGRNRAAWVRELAREAELLLERGVPLQGICLYPILGMPEWHEPTVWARLGLWDLVPASPTLRRVIYRPMRRALKEAQARLEPRFARAHVRLPT